MEQAARRLAGEASHPNLASLLTQAIARLDSLKSDFVTHQESLQELLARWKEERFHLAVLGQFKRGKSTLINALLGEALLPTSVLPLTAIPTLIRSGLALSAKVVYRDASAESFTGTHPAELARFLSRFVTEEANPGNRLGVSHVEVFHPSPILKKGLVIIDTPGIGSTYQHNTEMTLNFLPRCDAALFVISADPPITEVEVEFLKEVKSKLSRLFFVLNKTDYLDSGDREKVLAFFQKVLSEQIGMSANFPIFPISARQGLTAKQSNDAALWEGSGLSAIEHHLVDFLAYEKRGALQEALARRGSDLLADVLMQVRLAIRSLQMPVSDLEERSRWLEEKVREAQNQLVSARDLIEGDKKRTLAYLEEMAGNLRYSAVYYLQEVVQNSMATAGKSWNEEVAQKGMAEAIPGFFEHERGKMVKAIEERLQEVLKPHEKQRAGLVESIRKAAADLFDLPYRPIRQPSLLEKLPSPFWETRKWSASFELVPEGMLDRLLPFEKRRERRLRRLLKKIESLVLQNVEEIRWPLFQNIEETFGRFKTGMEESLSESIVSIYGAMEITRKKRGEHAESIADSVSFLESAARDLEEIQGVLQ